MTIDEWNSLTVGDVVWWYSDFPSEPRPMVVIEKFATPSWGVRKDLGCLFGIELAERSYGFSERTLFQTAEFNPAKVDHFTREHGAAFEDVVPPF